MKLRIKYAKTGCLKFIGHLDVMRYFQKAIRRAGLDVAYSQGFSPHQLITFAAPLGLGVTSEGEYFDGDFHSVTTTKDMVARMNATMAEGMQILDIRLLPKGAKTAMAIVSASDYLVSIKTGYYKEYIDGFYRHFSEFLSQSKIEILKTTKKSEQITDIKPMILEAYVESEIKTPFFDRENASVDQTNIHKAFYLKLAAGSNANLKPELVMEAYCNYLGVPYENFGFQVHRLETYMDSPDGGLMPLSDAGESIVQPISDI